jgi:hypothetical protein
MESELDSELRYLTYFLRGSILDATIKTERLIDEYLSFHFSRDASTGIEIKEMLFFTERITFGSKKDIFFILLDKYHKDFIKLNPTFKEKLDRLIPHRNIFAHYEIDLSNNLLDEGDLTIVFKKYKQGKLKPEQYQPERINNILTDFGYMIKILYELRGEAYKRINIVKTD